MGIENHAWQARAEKAEAALATVTEAEKAMRDKLGEKCDELEAALAEVKRLGDAMDDAWCVWADKCGIPVGNRYNDPTHAALSDERRAWRRATEAAGKGGE